MLAISYKYLAPSDSNGIDFPVVSKKWRIVLNEPVIPRRGERIVRRFNLQYSVEIRAARHTVRGGELTVT